MIALLCIPFITAVLCYLAPGGARAAGYWSLAGASALGAMAYSVIGSAMLEPQRAMDGLLVMDALSAYTSGLVIFLSLCTALYSVSYMEHELELGINNEKGVKMYYALFHIFVFTMLLVCTSNNLALMWIAIEATTIASAALIGLGYFKRAQAIEAAWKYIILCTVGITFALLGVFIAYYASISALGGKGSLNWDELSAVAHKLNGDTMKLAFIFILVGYGTKAGLAPMHSWLPDAHSEAPSPISALLSGVLLNTAFYGVMRFLALAAPSTGWEFLGNVLLVFGMMSVAVAAAFILIQRNFKRLLAYSSIEHVGIICIGTGLGGPAGVTAALLHALNHAVAKPLMFFTSGKIQSYYGSTRIDAVRGVLTAHPVWGTMMFIGALALAGSPPFNIFISEFMVLRAASLEGKWLVLGLLLLLLAVVFYGIMSAFGSMLFGQPSVTSQHGGHAEAGVSRALSSAVMVGLTVAVLVLGLHVPEFIENAIDASVTALGIR